MVVNYQVVDKLNDDSVKAALKLKEVKTDTAAFRLHYKLSVWLVGLYSFCYFYITFTKPISCVTTAKLGGSMYGKGTLSKAVRAYCLVHGTYVIENLDPAREIYPGIGGVTGKHDTIRYHHYYKWMYVYMFVMIIALHIPRQFWLSVECGRLKSLVKNLKCVLLISSEEIEKEKDKLADYVYCHLGNHRQYALGFVFGEFLNVVVSCSLMFLWDFITEHEFSTHGKASFDFMRKPPSLRTDRLAKVFPLLGKCNFNTYGPGGGIQTNDFICVLPLNLVNERAAIFFWYYFMFLVTVGITSLVVRVVLMTSKRVRTSLLSALTPLTSQEDLIVLTERCSYSDWFMIYQLGCNLESVVFREFMQKLLLNLRDSPKIL